ncbi:MAG TPA: PssE/Cps14G family polysaccharide biosynthesis glycosyltransferase [archaeon]|nr:PssE/Cps14G family polysaccharide biosynthesis glycosyltransferase [archaeon]
MKEHAKMQGKESIFVSVGTHPQQFDRLLRGIDALAENGKINGEIFAQTGYSEYSPKNYKFKKFLSLEEFGEKLARCSIFITHAGEGNIGQAKNLGKKFIAVPRSREFGEHTNNHQLELAQVVEIKKLGLVAWDMDELAKKLSEIGKFAPAKVASGRIPQILDDFIRKEFS